MYSIVLLASALALPAPLQSAFRATQSSMPWPAAAEGPGAGAQLPYSTWGEIITAQTSRLEIQGH